jgi:P22 coat protein - gene protein 5.
MSNTILTPSMITWEAARVLYNELSFTKHAFRGYDSRFAVRGAKIGQSLDIRLPNRVKAVKSATYSAQDYVDTKITLNVTTQAHVGMEFTNQELTMKMGDFSKLVIQPSVRQLANQIDRDGLAMYSSVYNVVNETSLSDLTPGAMVYQTLLNARAMLNLGAVPQKDRYAVVDPQSEVGVAADIKALFNPQGAIGGAFTGGMVPPVAGFKAVEMDQNVVTHTVGALGGTPLVNGASQTGASLVTDGWSNTITDIIKAGDVFTIAGVFSVNPQNYQSTGVLQRFVATANKTSSGAGAVTIDISPSITVTGNFQTVSNSPADDAAITVIGTAATGYKQSLAFHDEAFILGMADFELPEGTDKAYRVHDPDTNIAISFVRDFDTSNYKFISRLDVLYGWTVRPELALRMYTP